MTIPIDAEKAFNKIQHPFIIKKKKKPKTLQTLDTEDIYLNKAKAIYKNSTSLLMVKKWKPFL